MGQIKITGVLFDLDGVLVDAPQWHREALDKSLKFHGFKPLTEKEHVETFNGLSTLKKLEMLNKRRRVTKKAMPKINKMKQELTEKFIYERCKPIERIKEAVFWLYHHGFKTGVVTNCSRNSAHLMLRLSGLIGCWHTCITNGDVEGNIKPHPYPYEMGIRETSFWPQFALAIDDSHHGVESARAAGIKNIWHLENFSDLTLKNLKAKMGLFT
jgi:beta-phosphoglucomutase-like phosphatase (HAD superfamily)